MHINLNFDMYNLISTHSILFNNPASFGMYSPHSSIIALPPFRINSLAQTRQMDSLIITARPPTWRITPRLKIQIIIPRPTRLTRRTSQEVQLPPIRASCLRNNRIAFQAPRCRACRRIEVERQVGGARGSDVEIHGGVG